MVMETRSARRKRLGSRIENLPDEILHEILRVLPIKTAAQTVVLSRRWEKVFCSIPDLDFTTLTSSPNDRAITIKHVLANRDNDSSIRTLKMEADMGTVSLNIIVDYATRYNAQEILMLLPSLFDSDGFAWKTLMESKSLKALWLDSLLPAVDLNQYWLMSGAFKSLQWMTLTNLCFTAPDITYILSDSMFPSLRKLMLVWCFGVAGLNINCSKLTDLVLDHCFGLNALDVFGLKLERMTVIGCFTSMHNIQSRIQIIAPVVKYLKWVGNQLIHIPVLEVSSLLEKAVIGTGSHEEDIKDYFDEPEYCSWKNRLFNVIIALSHVKILKLHHPFIEILTYYDLKSISINKFENLRQLKICCQVKQFCLSNIRGVTVLLKHTPYLDTLIINIDPVHQYLLDTNDDINWEDEIPEIISFLNHLKTVKFIGFLEYVKELCSFVKFLLEHGKVLQNMSLFLGRSNSRKTRRTRINSVLKLWSSSKITVF